MNQLSHKLLVLALIVALPSLGCFSYYTLEDADSNTTLPVSIILLAYPVLLISLTSIIAMWVSKRRSRLGSWLAGACLLVSAAILLIARF